MTPGCADISLRSRLQPAKNCGARTRFPQKGEPGSETWGKLIDYGGGATWLSGTFDPDLNTLYWTTGNPWPDFFGVDRGGDNLYSCSLLALDANTGKIKWHFQFTPHDTHDWDAQSWPVLVDLPYRRTDAQTGAAREPQRFSLRSRPRHGRVPECHAARRKARLGQRHRCPGTPDSGAWQGSDAHRQPGLSERPRSHQLDVALLRFGQPDSST